MIPSQPARDIAPAGQPLELLFERPGTASFDLPSELTRSYGGGLGFPNPCLFANFVTSLDGLVALPGDTESGQIISGRNQADRFVMGLLRACADAVLVGAGTFRKSGGHLWHPDRIYPAAAHAFAEMRQRLGLSPQPELILLSASGSLDMAEPAARSAWLFTTQRGEATLRGGPRPRRLTVLDSERVRLEDVLREVRAAGLPRVLTEGGPALFAELVQERLVDELFLTSSPRLFGRFPRDQRKSLADGLDLAGSACELLSVRRHGSHLFSRYAFDRARAFDQP